MSRKNHTDLSRRIATGLTATILAILIFTKPSFGQKSSTPLPFRFRARFSFPGAKEQRRTLPMGALIRPVEKNNPDLEYQTIVTCADLDLKFNENGISDWIEIRGLCFAPGLKPPPSGVEWVITGAFVQKVRLEGGCAKDLRQSQVECRLPWCTERPIVEQECPHRPSECMRQFEGLTQRWYKKRLHKAVEDGLCITDTKISDDLKQIQVLRCLAKATR